MSYIDVEDEDDEEQKAADIRRARELEDIRFLMQTEKGRRVMWRLLSRCGTFQNPADFGNVNATFHRLGEQAVGRWLFSEIDQGAPEFFETMKRENRHAD